MSDKDTKKLLVGLAEVYGTTLSDQRLQLYADLLSDIPFPVLTEAARAIMRDPNIRQFPLPAQIREKAMPGANPEHEAIEAVNRIVEAMNRFGWPDPTGARAFIGELGWMVVERSGGWSLLCEGVTMDQLPSYRAQWRELAKALYGRAQRGDTEPPTIGPGGRDPRKLVDTVTNKLKLVKG